MDTIKKVMDNDKLMKYQKDLKNVIYGKYLFEHLKNNENSLVVAITLKNDINEYVNKIIKSIFPEQKGIKIYINQNKIDFMMDPRDLKYKETITNKCLKSFTIDCIFDAFTAFDGNCYLASSHGTPFSIEIYNLSNNKVAATLNILKQIYIIRHYAQFSKRIDYLLTTTTEKSIKIFNLNTFKEHLTISNCYTGTYMYSALLLFDDLGVKNYVVTSSPNDYIKFWNLDNGKFIKNVGSKDDYTYFINYWKNNDKYYIIDANADNVKIYGTDKENQLFGEYSGKERTWHMCAFVDKMNDIDTLFESDGKGYVRLWNLENHQLIKSIQCQPFSLRGMTLWNQKYIIVASSDKSFKILDLEEGKLALSVSGQHVNSMCSVKKIMHPLYGESLLTGSIDGTIKLWINKSLMP
jgi:WD40 repeat protein